MKNGERIGLDLDRDLDDEGPLQASSPFFHGANGKPAVLTWSNHWSGDKSEST